MSCTIHSFRFASTSGLAEIAALKYIPDGEVTAVLQIAHGMAEHKERYDAFAKVLAEGGIAVYINDHLGHGESVSAESELGYFGEGGWRVMVEDCFALHGLAREEYPDLPYFMFGHSMGSFVAREYVRTHGDDLAGGIICGTGGKNPAAGIGIALVNMIAGCKGEHHRSKLIDNIAFGSYNKRCPGRTNFDWLTRDDNVVDTYIADPLCGFLFTVNGFRGLFQALDTVSQPKWYAEVRQDLPLLLIAGDEDPVGAYGKGVVEVCDKLAATGHNVQMQLFDGCRHEILNESAMVEAVYECVLQFIGENK